MNVLIRWWCIVLTITVVIFIQCSVKARVIDIYSNATVVSSLRVSGSRSIEILQGKAVREIKLETIRVLNLAAGDTRVFNRKTYILGELQLRDGSVIGALQSDTKSDNKMYVNVNSIVQGETASGLFRIPLFDVLRIEIVQ